MFNYRSTLMGIGLCLLTSVGLTQTYNISTGWDNSASSIFSAGSVDDTWEVMIPNQTSFTSTFVYSFPNGNPNCRAIGVNASTTYSYGGIYTYRMTFYRDPCAGPIQSAVVSFISATADDELLDMSFNGNPAYFLNSWGINNPGSGNITINLNDVVSGWNTIDIRIFNWSNGTANSTSPHYMQLNASLIITNGTLPSLSPPSVIHSNGILNGTSSDIGNHLWEIYCAPNGNTGPYSLVASFNTASFTFNSTCDCYYVKHTIESDCDILCTAQIICEASCDLDECMISAPTGLGVTHLNSFQSQFTWNPVMGASSYIIEITPNDPACCGGDQMFISAPLVFPAATNSEIIDFSQVLWPMPSGGYGEGAVRCFSWRVRAVCADGSLSNYSQSMCSNAGGEPWQRPAKTGSSMTEDSGSETLQATSTSGGSINAAEAVFFPNPAKESVEIYVRGLQSETINIQILDVSGKVVKTIKNVRTENGQISKQLNVESFDKGTYLIQISSDGSTVMTERLVVE